ncbi:nucleotide-binding universal stress UspA family protein [Chryseobacterium ginsenosidimutans]|uniref:universal stress protein n=1 Tax=Chryseobacterium ginsenosidimutans TaxID=687846 RepID=UPI0021676D1D|nr:universal stress protein [Chryseobacterium ginsenosidimutans]MCS3870318.1 nucleotide-binding universal stress UspA family protein [Chryseobacterium ginsenosidimutans]
MKQILVASDFSNSAGNALKYALSLAKILQMEIAVINAIHPTEGINNSTYNAIFIEDYYAKKRSALKEWTETFTQHEDYKDIPVKTICDVGFLRSVITKYTEYHAVSFLVMGITGATGIKGIVGSNASMAVTKMRIPTLIVPLESVLSTDPIITLATDYKTARLSVRDVKALNQILKVSKPKKLKVLHVSERDMDEKSIRNGEKKLKDLIPSVEIDFNYVDDDGKTSNEIIDFIEQNETDILCLVKRNQNIIYRLFASSTVNEVLNKSVKAILVLHE